MTINQQDLEENERATSVLHWLEPLKKYLNEDESITEIVVNRPQEIWYERDGVWHKDDAPELTFDHCLSLGIAVAFYAENDFNADKAPILSAVLPGNERSQFVMPPACEEGTISITIRKPSKRVFKIEDYVNNGFFDRVLPVTNDISESDQELLDMLGQKDYQQFLVEAVKREKNIVVAGATGSGKTTFMKTLNEEIPATDRIITIEDVPELFLLRHPNHVHLFYPSNANEKSPVTPAALLKSCLRMKPDRILLAELRGAEAWDYIQICASGHGGSITSLHAGSVAEVFERLMGMYLSNPKGQGMASDVIMRTLRMTIDVVVHMDNHKGIGRGITQIYFDPRRKIEATAL